MNAGLHAAGGALAQRAGDMPNRISMNVTVPKQTTRVDVDGATVEVDIANDGQLAGRAAVVVTEARAPAAGTP